MSKTLLQSVGELFCMSKNMLQNVGTFFCMSKTLLQNVSGFFYIFGRPAAKHPLFFGLETLSARNFNHSLFGKIIYINLKLIKKIEE
jgi:hypothetical protein